MNTIKQYDKPDVCPIRKSTDPSCSVCVARVWRRCHSPMKGGGGKKNPPTKNEMTGCPACRYHAQCSETAYLCPAAEAYAGMQSSREPTLNPDAIDRTYNPRHYLEVINEIAASVEHRQQLEPIITPALLRRFIVHALTSVHYPARIIADALNVSLRTIRYDRKAPLP
jgi:hypothetical protein